VATYGSYTSLGAGNNFLAYVPFPFLAETHVKVRRKLSGSNTYTELTYRTNTAWEALASVGANGFPNDPNSYRVVLEESTNQYYVQVSRAYGGETWIIYRDTPREDSLFVNSSALTAEDLNLAFKKVSYLAEESDQINIVSSTTTFDSKYDKTGGTITGNVSISGSASIGTTLTLNNNKITGVATPTSASDVATKAYVDLANSPGGVPTILPDSITSTELSKSAGSEAVATNTIRNLAVTADKIADLTITNGKIADGTIASAKLVSPITATIGAGVILCANDGSLNPLYSQPSDSAGSTINLRKVVTTDAIRVGAVTTTRLADSAVSSAKLGTNAVITSKILNSNVTGEKIAPSTITTDKLLTTGFSFDASGNVNATSLVSSGNIQTSGVVRKPNPSSETFSQSWSTFDPSLSYLGTGFSIVYKPQFTGNPSSSIIPNLIRPASEPFRVMFKRAFWGFPNNPNSTLIPRYAWTKKIFNTITFNNTNFFGLNGTTGEFIIDGANNPSARGTWKLTCNFYITLRSDTGPTWYIATRLTGPGYNTLWNGTAEYLDTTFSNTASLFYGPYLSTVSESPTLIPVRLEGTFVVDSYSSVPYWVDMFVRPSYYNLGSTNVAIDSSSNLLHDDSVNGFGTNFPFASSDDYRASMGVCELVKIA
jgi:hypothetical protein